MGTVRRMIAWPDSSSSFSFELILERNAQLGRNLSSVRKAKAWTNSLSLFRRPFLRNYCTATNSRHKTWTTSKRVPQFVRKHGLHVYPKGVCRMDMRALSEKKCVLRNIEFFEEPCVLNAVFRLEYSFQRS